MVTEHHDTGLPRLVDTVPLMDPVSAGVGVGVGVRKMVGVGVGVVLVVGVGVVLVVVAAIVLMLTAAEGDDTFPAPSLAST